MSNTTITINATLNWCLAFTVQRPNKGVAGVTNEPGLTCANKIAQTILAPPFKWPWNRVETSFVLTQGISDYLISLSNFGFLEKVAIRPGGGAIGQLPARELNIVQVLAGEVKQNVPQDVAPLLDDNNGNITFRFLPTPDQVYTAYITYQKMPVLFTDPAGLWAPIPDRFAFLYEQGMLAHLQLMYSPQLYGMNIELFYRQLVGAAEGLTDTERAIFLEDKLRTLRFESSVIGQQQLPSRLQR